MASEIQGFSNTPPLLHDFQDASTNLSEAESSVSQIAKSLLSKKDASIPPATREMIINLEEGFNLTDIFYADSFGYNPEKPLKVFSHETYLKNLHLTPAFYRTEKGTIHPLKNFEEVLEKRGIVKLQEHSSIDLEIDGQVKKYTVGRTITDREWAFIQNAIVQVLSASEKQKKADKTEKEPNQQAIDPQTVDIHHERTTKEARAHKEAFTQRSTTSQTERLKAAQKREEEEAHVKKQEAEQQTEELFQSVKQERRQINEEKLQKQTNDKVVSDLTEKQKKNKIR